MKTDTQHRTQGQRAGSDAETAQTAASAATTEVTTPTLEELMAAHEGRHPMGRVRDWMVDFGVLGAVTGLVAAVTHMLFVAGVPLSTSWPVVLATPMLLGFAATLAGAVAGGALRALRGKVSAAIGVFLAAMAVNMVGSFITVAMPWDRITSATIIEGKAAPLSLAVLLLIPLVAVLRSRRQSTFPWLMAAGALAGVLIGLT